MQLPTVPLPVLAVHVGRARAHRYQRLHRLRVAVSKRYIQRRLAAKPTSTRHNHVYITRPISECQLKARVRVASDLGTTYALPEPKRRNNAFTSAPADTSALNVSV